ncbi:MAG TPA: aminotransferase class IV [Lentimicrobium sp.]|jgi:4-amino-4-deoxychorismate lyase|nr:aminotransferase class IV [Lentimicrobium sp.]
MSPLFETILVVDGVAQNLSWHAARVASSSEALWGMRAVLQEALLIPPSGFETGSVRCRINYAAGEQTAVWVPHIHRPVNSLRLLTDDGMDYPYKYCDRRDLDRLFARRGMCDDVLIVRNGRITDTSIANLLLKSGNKWYTPVHPLLQGTCRARLLAEGIAEEAGIRAGDLHLFSRVLTVNALRGFRESEAFSIHRIV